MLKRLGQPILITLAALAAAVVTVVLEHRGNTVPNPPERSPSTIEPREPVSTSVQMLGVVRGTYPNVAAQRAGPPREEAQQAASAAAERAAHAAAAVMDPSRD